MGVMSAGLGIMQQQAATRAQNAQIEYQNQVAEQEYQYNIGKADAARTNEAQQKQLQDDVIAQNFFLANEAYESDIAALNLRMMQEQAAAGAEKRKTSLAALQAKGEVVAAGRVGNSIQNLIADVQRQQAAFDYATDQNLAFTGKQLKEQKRGAGVERASRIASQQPYLERTILDPWKPIKRQKVKGPGLVGFLSAGLGGVSTGLNTQVGLKQAGLI
jgi:Rps23 Pro-64 3,4-dihydroxylase Tpa1-like proline 4-hydroxylase